MHLVLLVLLGCSTSPTDDDTTTIAAVCDAIFTTCDGFGLADRSTCEAEFLAAGGCESQRPDYLACMAPCVELSDCTAFQDCEAACFDETCPSL